MITETTEKREIVIVLGENEALASAHFKAVRFLRNEDGSDAAPPQEVRIPASGDDVAKHIGAAAAEQANIVDAQTQRITELTGDVNTLAAALKARTDELEATAQKLTDLRAAIVEQDNGRQALFNKAHEQFVNNISPLLRDA